MLFVQSIPSIGLTQRSSSFSYNLKMRADFFPQTFKECVDEALHIAFVREAEEIEEVGVHLHVLDVIEALAEEEHVELPMVVSHCKELLH